MLWNIIACSGQNYLAQNVKSAETEKLTQRITFGDETILWLVECIAEKDNIFALKNEVWSSVFLN